jgi:hypothetical protein
MLQAGLICRTCEDLRALQKHGMDGQTWHTGSYCKKIRNLQCWWAEGEAFLLCCVCFPTAGIKMAVTTLGSTEMMKENWPQGALSPLSPSVLAGTSSCGTGTAEERTGAGGWRWSGCSWPTEACCCWTTQPTLTGITVSLSARRFWLHGSIWHFVQFCLLRNKCFEGWVLRVPLPYVLWEEAALSFVHRALEEAGRNYRAVT